MNFMSGISSIQVRPTIAPANKIGEGIAVAKAARQAEVMAAVPAGEGVTVEQLAALLQLPVALVRVDVNSLIIKGTLVDSWDGRYRYIRRSKL